MATISKFYLHDAATANTGTMPGAGDAFQGGSPPDTGEATGAFTARTANDTIGVGQTSATITATANQNPQQWGMRRFVSSPLAAHTFGPGDGNWTFSQASAESNLNHNQSIRLFAYQWRPSTGLRIGTGGLNITIAEPGSASTQTAASATQVSGSMTFIDGDILVFEVYDQFTQGMSVGYTSTFYYDGTTEASSTNCASFVTPPAALTLFTGGTTYTKSGWGSENA